MSGGATAVVAIVLLVIFIIGVAVGFIAVIAISVRRAGKTGRRSPRDGWPHIEEADHDDRKPDEPARWPGDAGHGFGDG